MSLRIGISCMPDKEPYPRYGEAVHAAAKRLGLDVEVVDLASRAGAIASVDGVLFTGGPDIAPERFGKSAEVDRCRRIDRKRDGDEFRLSRIAREREVPILGICRGLQLLNVDFGGNLITDIETKDDHVKRADGEDARHAVLTERDSLVAQLAGAQQSEVNSSHHQAIDHLAEPFVATARADDGTIEAVEWADPNDKPFLLAVQWHPERMDQSEPLAGAIFERFLSAAKAFATSRRRSSP